MKQNPVAHIDNHDANDNKKGGFLRGLRKVVRGKKGVPYVFTKEEHADNLEGDSAKEERLRKAQLMRRDFDTELEELFGQEYDDFLVKRDAFFDDFD